MLGHPQKSGKIEQGQHVKANIDQSNPHHTDIMFDARAHGLSSHRPRDQQCRPF